MKSAAPDVPSYIASQPAEWRDTLERLRDSCRRHLVGYGEAMSYGMPSYARAERVEVSYAKQARYLSLYVLKQPVLDAHRAQLVHLDVGKGCIRFRRPDDIDWDVVASLLRATAADAGEIC